MKSCPQIFKKVFISFSISRSANVVPTNRWLLKKCVFFPCLPVLRLVKHAGEVAQKEGPEAEAKAPEDERKIQVNLIWDSLPHTSGISGLSCNKADGRNGFLSETVSLFSGEGKILH